MTPTIIGRIGMSAQEAEQHKQNLRDRVILDLQEWQQQAERAAQTTGDILTALEQGAQVSGTILRQVRDGMDALAPDLLEKAARIDELLRLEEG